MSRSMRDLSHVAIVSWIVMVQVTVLKSRDCIQNSIQEIVISEIAKVYLNCLYGMSLLRIEPITPLNFNMIQ